MYHHGEGIAQNLHKVKFWYEKSAYNGYPIAYENIGLMSENGMDTCKDFNHAKTYYKKAANSGIVTAAEKLKKLN